MSGQICDNAIDATALVIDMSESGGAGIWVRTLTDLALDRWLQGRGAAGEWPADTTVYLDRLSVRVETLPPPRKTLPRRLRITVVHPD